MNLKTNDTQLLLTDQELMTLTETIDTLKKIRQGFTVVAADTIAGFDKDDYTQMIKVLDELFRRAARDKRDHVHSDIFDDMDKCIDDLFNDWEERMKNRTKGVLKYE